MNSLSFSLSKTLKSRKLLVTIDFGKVRVDRFFTHPSFRQVMMFNSNFYFIILYFRQVRHLFTPEFHKKKYTKEALGFSTLAKILPARVFGRVKTVFFFFFFLKTESK